MAFSAEQDKDLVAINVEHLFGITISQIAIKKDRYIKPYVYPFIEMFAPHLTQSLIREAIACADIEARQELFATVSVPMY
jgi:LysR family cys regulon transcriptional activator